MIWAIWQLHSIHDILYVKCLTVIFWQFYFFKFNPSIGQILNWELPYTGNLLREEIFVNHTILLSEEIVTILDYCIHNSRYIEDVWIQKCVLTLCNICWCIGDHKICKIKTLVINSCYVALSNHGDDCCENHKCVIFIIIKHFTYTVMCSDNVLV